MTKQFHDRHFPVRPNLDQLKHQAKDLLRAVRQGDSGGRCGVAETPPREHQSRTLRQTCGRAACAGPQLRSTELVTAGHGVPHD